MSNQKPNQNRVKGEQQLKKFNKTVILSSKKFDGYEREKEQSENNERYVKKKLRDMSANMQSLKATLYK